MTESVFTEKEKHTGLLGLVNLYCTAVEDAIKGADSRHVYLMDTLLNYPGYSPEAIFHVVQDVFVMRVFDAIDQWLAHTNVPKGKWYDELFIKVSASARWQRMCVEHAGVDTPKTVQ